MRKIISAVMAAALAFAVLPVAAMAESIPHPGNWRVTYTSDGKMTDNYSASEYVDAVSGLQPGDDITFAITSTGSPTRTRPARSARCTTARSSAATRATAWLTPPTPLRTTSAWGSSARARPPRSSSAWRSMARPRAMRTSTRWLA